MIPANAILHRVKTGKEHEGLSPHNPSVVSFYYEGMLHFNIIGKTVPVQGYYD
jgi:hypothetical protein